jgi:hypothetical protein
MTDTPGIDAGAGAGAAADATPAPMTKEVAESRYNEILSGADKEWTTRYLNGGLVERAEMDRITKAISPPPVAVRTDTVSMDQHVAAFKEWAGEISPEIEAELREQRPVSPREHSLAKQRKAERMSDRQWVVKYLDGGRAEAREMALLNLILSSRVRDPEPATK